MFYGNLENKLSILVKRALKETAARAGLSDNSAFDRTEIQLEMPKMRSHGDLSTNIAMKLSRLVSKYPLEIAVMITEHLKQAVQAPGMKKVIEKVEVKEPGFINFFLHKSYLYRVLLDIKRQKNRYGQTSAGRSRKVNIEFVSANPTGPLTVAHGRQAAFGDSLANILGACGYEVEREYYVNDEGRQINLLGASVRARYLELLGKDEPLPQDGYQGAYIKNIAADFKKRYGKKFAENDATAPFADFSVKWMLKNIKKDLADFGVNFDVWFSQKKLGTSGEIQKTLAILRKKGLIYEKDGAQWFASTRFGDDKDRVVRKSDNSLTYLAPDIAYHLDKQRRKYRRFIDIWGPDHHGYVPRISAAVKALGCREGALSVLLVQLATILRAGKPLAMSTRRGEFITLREVMDEVGKDVTRFCFLMRKLDSHLNFDLEVVKSRSMENPVYYIQYAHARICSIARYARKIRRSRFNSRALKEEEELDLLRMLRQFPVVVRTCAKFLEPYGLLSYLQQLAGAFHNFYDKHRVVGDDPAVTRARLVLVECVRIVLANGLKLLGVSLPEKM